MAIVVQLTRYGLGTCSDTRLYHVAEILVMASMAVGSAHTGGREDIDSVTKCWWSAWKERVKMMKIR
jgi:hypothetical protein